MSKKNGQRYSTAQFIAAIDGSGGIVTTIAKRVGCSWNTAKKWIDEYPTVAAAYSDEQETINDMAEGMLMQSIRKGNTQDAKWWLSRIRKDRFAERREVTGADGSDVQIINVTLKGVSDASSTDD